MLYRHRRVAACLLAVVMLASMIGVADSKKRHRITVESLVRKADGQPYKCDFDRDRRYGPKQTECVIRVVWPRSSENAAVSVARCESNLKPWAKNPRSTASGVFQFLSGTWGGNPQFKKAYRQSRTRGSHYGRAIHAAYRAVFDPVRNTRGALWLYQRSGWSPWVCKP
jgi:hypothetical protein